jgi:hypothetical protein
MADAALIALDLQSESILAKGSESYDVVLSTEASDFVASRWLGVGRVVLEDRLQSYILRKVRQKIGEKIAVKIASKAVPGIGYVMLGLDVAAIINGDWYLELGRIIADPTIIGPTAKVEIRTATFEQAVEVQKRLGEDFSRLFLETILQTRRTVEALTTRLDRLTDEQRARLNADNPIVFGRTIYLAGNYTVPDTFEAWVDGDLRAPLSLGDDRFQQFVSIIEPSGGLRPANELLAVSRGRLDRVIKHRIFDVPSGKAGTFLRRSFEVADERQFEALQKLPADERGMIAELDEITWRRIDGVSGDGWRETGRAPISETVKAYKLAPTPLREAFFWRLGIDHDDPQLIQFLLEWNEKLSAFTPDQQAYLLREVYAVRSCNYGTTQTVGSANDLAFYWAERLGANINDIRKAERRAAR